MTIPKFDESFISILKVLKDENREIHRNELKKKVYERFYKDNMTEYERKQRVKTGGLLIETRLGFAFSYLKIGKFVFNPKKGYWQITEKGVKWLEEEKPLNLKILEKDSDYIEYQKKKKLEKENKKIKISNFNNDVIDENISLSSKEKIKEAITDLEFELKQDLLDRLRHVDPYYFEKIILKLFKKMGYGDFETTKKSSDGGIDGIINQDMLGVEKIYTQAKRYSKGNLVGGKDMTNFMGAMTRDGVSKGIFVTTSDFSDTALNYVKNHQMILINGDKLVDLMVEYGVGVEVKEVYKIKQIDEDFFLDDDE